jgi:predicted nucleic acid-binding protein
MNVLVDTNILVRLSDPDSPLCSLCNAAVRDLLSRGDRLHLCAQTAIEFWSVATRPKAVNGLGYSPAQADAALREAEQLLVWLPEPPDIGAHWRTLATKHGICGKQAHDTRVAALMQAHGLTHLLTLNAADFSRFDWLTCLHPENLS